MSHTAEQIGPQRLGALPLTPLLSNDAVHDPDAVPIRLAEFLLFSLRGIESQARGISARVRDRRYMRGAGGLILAAEFLYLPLAFASWNNGWTDVSIFVGIIAAQFAIVLYAASRLKIGTPMLLAGAVLFRLTLLPAGFEDGEWQRFQLYDSDIWRYLWDGHVTASGANPYRFAPHDPAQDALAASEYWTNVRENINYGGIPTIYPPAAQVVFLLAHPFGVLGMKIVSTVFDLAALAFLMLTLRVLKRPMSDALWYAWNPLAIKVFAGSGHMDSLAVAGLAAMFYAIAVGSTKGSTTAYAIAILSKWSPLALLPILIKARVVRPTLLLLLVLPVFGIPNVLAGASVFAEFWEFNALPFSLLRELFHSATIAKLAAAALVLATILKAGIASEGDLETIARRTGYTLGALIVLAPAVMPWYVTWLLPSAVLARDYRWVAFSGLVFLAFFVMVDGQERWWITAAEYGGLLLFWVYKGDRHESAFVVGHRAIVGAGAR